jgi:hypothetical protein
MSKQVFFKIVSTEVSEVSDKVCHENSVFMEEKRLTV